MADANTQTLEHVRELAGIHTTLATEAPPLLHWTTDPHYPGYECLSMAERSFGRALRLWESLTRYHNEPVKVGLMERAGGGVWDCWTPNRDSSESRHVIYEYADRPWVVNKVEELGAGVLRESASPFSLWANLDARPRYDENGKALNLVAWNANRLRDHLPPYTVSLHADDKHAILLQLMQGVQFTCFRQRLFDIHPSALREMVRGYQGECEDWLSQAEFDRLRNPTDDDNPFAEGDDLPAPAVDDNPFRD